MRNIKPTKNEKQFDAKKFNADYWVSVAKAAGMKYIVLTTKHHDGFCLWNTRQTDFNLMNSPLKRDVVKELAETCRKHGMAFGTYYSTCDWHNPDSPLTSPGGRVTHEKSNLEIYTTYLKKQVTETCCLMQVQSLMAQLNPVNTIVELEYSGNVMKIEPLEINSYSLSYMKSLTASSNPIGHWSNHQWVELNAVTNGDWSGAFWKPGAKDLKPWVEIDAGKKVIQT